MFVCVVVDVDENSTKHGTAVTRVLHFFAVCLHDGNDSYYGFVPKSEYFTAESCVFVGMLSACLHTCALLARSLSEAWALWDFVVFILVARVPGFGRVTHKR